MNKKKVVILVNEEAGRKRGPKGVTGIAARAALEGFEPVVYPIIPGKINSEDILPPYENDADMILCVGGDGTINHVVSAMMNMSRRPKLAYIPSGSTNDFSKSLGIPVNFEAALNTAFKGDTFSFDVGRMNDSEYFNYTAAFGAFSKTSYSTDQKLKNVLGYAAYILSAAASIHENLSFKRHIRIETEDFTEEGDYVFGTVCNSVSIGGLDFMKNFDVRLDDGIMELLLVKAPRNVSELGKITGSLMKGNVNDPFISLRQVSRVRFFSEEKLAWSIDGEYGGEAVETCIEVEPRAITVCSARSAR